VSNLTRRQRESRAFTLTLATGGGGVATAVTFITWVVGATGFGLFFILAVITALCFFALRRTLGT